MPSADSSDFGARLASAKAGDELAWRSLFRLVSGRVVGFLVVRGASDPEGIAGDTFVDIVCSIRRFKGGEREFIAWCLTIAHRRLIDSWRSAGRRPEVLTDPSDLEEPDDLDVEDTALGLMGAARTRLLLDRLTPDQADVLALRIYGDLTLPEIAKRLSKPVTAVTSLQYRGLESLRRLLAESE